MKLNVSDIKYINSVNELISKEVFEKYIDYLISNRINKFVCYVDIDNMNEINSKYGNQIGSKVINEISVLLISNELIDCVVRDESDEFLFAINGDYETIYNELIKKIRTLHLKEIDADITLSIVFMYISDGESFKDIYDYMKSQMPRAKAKGKNCAIFLKREKEVYGNLVIPHLICQFCHKRTDIDDFNIKTLTYDDFLRDSFYKNKMIHRCNRCNTAALNLKEPFEFDKSILDSSDYQNILKQNMPDNEKNILLAASIYVKNNDYYNAGMLMYLYYEITKKENALNYVGEYLEKCDSFEARILEADAFRKYDLPDIFEKRLKYYKGKNKFERMLINLEEYKIFKKDTSNLNYSQDIIYKHLYKEDVYDHENLTGLDIFDGNNIEKIHSIYEVPAEYKLITVFNCKDNIYGIFVIPYLNVSRVYQFKLFTKEIFLEYIDCETAEEIIGTYIEGDNYKPKYNYYDFENIKTKTLKLLTGYKTCYFINDWEYSDLEEFALDRENEGLMSSHYDYNHEGYDKVIANPTYIKKLHVKKNVKEMFLYNFVVSEIYYDGTLNDWVKIQKNGFQYIRDKLFNKPQFYELYILDYDGDIDFYGNRYSKVENIVIDKSEIIKSHSFYSMKGIKTVSLKGVKIVEEKAFENTDIEEFYISSDIEVLKSDVSCKNFNKFNDGFYFGDRKKKHILLFDYNASNLEFIVHNDCKVIRGRIKNKELLNKIILDNTKIVDVPKEYFKECKNVKVISLPKTIKTIGWCAFTDIDVEELYYDGTIEDFNNIKIDSIGYDPITLRPEDVGSSPLKNFTKFYLLDDNGDVIYNNKKYKLHK